MEVNSSFYALPQAKHTSRWASYLEPWPDFRMIMKLHQSFTHEPWNDAQLAESGQRFSEALAPLKRRKLLAGILVQFPVTFLNTAEAVVRLGHIRSLFGGENLILEVRHSSWFEPPGLNSIRGLGYSLAHIDLPTAWNHPPDRHMPTGPIGYLRLHGRNDHHWFNAKSGRDQRYDYLYPPPEVGQMAAKADAISRESDQTYVVTNNHFEGKAMANALELRYLLEGRHPVPAPGPLVSTYPHLQPVTRVEGQTELF
ncbi:MAG: DUF72 domain-containing protein [Planctomycetota bacterium]|nr:DUF72 domain-containing protein [Planctomycetota bacterium]